MLVLIQAFVLLEHLRHLERMWTSRWHFSHLPPRLPNTPPSTPLICSLLSRSLAFVLSPSVSLPFCLSLHVSLFLSLTFSLSHSIPLSLSLSSIFSFPPTPFSGHLIISSWLVFLLTITHNLYVCLVRGFCSAQLTYRKQSTALCCWLGKEDQTVLSIKMPTRDPFSYFWRFRWSFFFCGKHLYCDTWSVVVCPYMLWLPVIEIKIDAFLKKKNEYTHAHALSLSLVICHSWRNYVKGKFLKIWERREKSR